MPELTEAAKEILADRDAEQDIIIAHVREQLSAYQKKGLADGWIIEVKAFPGMHACMSVDWEPGYRYVELRVNTENADIRRGGWLFRYFILHELCHLLIAPVTDVIQGNFKPDSSFLAAFGAPTEHATDNVAKILWAMLGEESIHAEVH